MPMLLLVMMMTGDQGQYSDAYGDKYANEDDVEEEEDYEKDKHFKHNINVTFPTHGQFQNASTYRLSCL